MEILIKNSHRFGFIKHKTIGVNILSGSSDHSQALFLNIIAETDE